MAQLAVEARREPDDDTPGVPVAPGDWLRAAAELEGQDPTAAVRWALERFPRGRVAVVTGLQADGVAVATMALDVDPRVRILTIDTGRLHAETLAYIDTLRARWQRDIEVVRPDPARVAAMVAAHGVDLFYVSPELRQACCTVRKVDALDAVMTDVDCWLVGLRRGQSATRGQTPIIGADPQRPGVLKVSPLAVWSEEQTMAYLRDREVPLHPLYARGYRSIGCEPCTRATGPGEPERAGRWWWEQGMDTECGLHTADRKGGRA